MKLSQKIIIGLFILLSIFLIYSNSVLAVIHNNPHNQVFSLVTQYTGQVGARITTPKDNIILLNATIYNPNALSPSTCRLYSTNYTLLLENTADNFQCVFNTSMIKDDIYYITADGTGYNLYGKDGTASFPYNSVDINWVGGFFYAPSNTSVAFFNFIDVITEEVCYENWLNNDTACNGNNYTIQYYDNSSCGTNTSLNILNGTIINCSLENWARTIQPCTSNSRFISYTDLNESGYIYHLPSNNNSYEYCSPDPVLIHNELDIGNKTILFIALLIVTIFSLIVGIRSEGKYKLILSISGSFLVGLGIFFGTFFDDKTLSLTNHILIGLLVSVFILSGLTLVFIGFLALFSNKKIK